MGTDALERWLLACVGRPGLVALLTAIAAVFGADALLGLQRDVFPDLSTPVYSVIVQNPAMGAEELEAGVAIPLEGALTGLPHVRRVRSTSQLGVSQVVVEFAPDADVLRARQAIVERLAEVELPPGTGAPLVSSLTGRLNEIFEFTLEAEPGTADLTTLRDLAEFEVGRRLLAVPGVAAVERLGGFLRQIQVQMDPDRMAARGVTLDEVVHAAEGSHRNAAGGLVQDGDTEWTVRAVGGARNAEDVRATVVRVEGDVPVLLGEVADVVEAPAVRRGLAHRLSGEVVSCRVSKQFGADTAEVAAGLRAAIAELEPTLPRGVHLRVVYDQSELVDRSISGVGRSVAVGGVFVAAVLVALLGHLRAAALVTLTIPLSLALAALGLRQLGVGLNAMTLGGLAIAVGLVVDASIIVCENALHRRGAGGDRAEVARAAAEVGRPIAFATAIVVAVFLPLLAMEGIEGRMYRPLAAAVIASLGASLALALSFTPVAAAWGLGAGEVRDTRVIRWIKRVQAPVLDLALRAPWAVVALCALAVGPAGAAALWVGRDFMPELDEGALLVQTFLPPEASLDTVDRLNHRVEDELRAVPEVVEVVRRTGRAERTEDPMPHTVSDVLVLLDPGRARGIEAIEDDVRERLSHVLGVRSAITTPLGMRIDEGLGGTPADLAVRLYGYDLEDLREAAARVQGALAEVRGLADSRAESMAELPQIRVDVDRAAAARVGLTPGDVVDAVQVGLVGATVAEVRVGARVLDLVVRLRPDRAGSADQIGGLLVDGHDGTRIPLAKLASVTRATGPGVLRREAGARRVSVEVAVAGTDLGTAADRVRAALREVELPEGVRWELGGRVEGQARATASLLRAVLLAVVAVGVLLQLALGSVRETALILVTLPVALVGGVAGLIAFGETWNVSSMVGVIGLFGIAVQNGLVLVTQTRALRAGGLDARAAVRAASLDRVRPKLLTAGTAMLGLLPMVAFDLHGSELERPLAAVMIGGLVSSTGFTLIVLPALYAAVARSAPEQGGGQPG